MLIKGPSSSQNSKESIHDAGPSQSQKKQSVPSTNEGECFNFIFFFLIFVFIINYNTNLNY